MRSAHGEIGEIRLPVRSTRSPKLSRLRACLYRRIWRPDSSFTFNLALQQFVPYDRQLFHLGLRKPFEEPPTHPGQVGRGRLGQPLGPRPGDAREHLARIVVTPMAFEESLAFHPIY